MSLAIRLARGGMKKKPYYRIVVTDSRNARDGKFIEKIGTYNPLLNKENPERVKLDGERAAHWLGVGAQPSDRVARFLDAAGLRTRAARSNPNKGVPGDKAKERADAAVAKQAELDAAAADAAEKAKAAAAEAAATPAPEPVEAPSDVELPVETPSAESAPELADVPAATPDVDTATETDASPAGPAI